MTGFLHSPRRKVQRYSNRDAVLVGGIVSPAAVLHVAQQIRVMQTMHTSPCRPHAATLTSSPALTTDPFKLLTASLATLRRDETQPIFFKAHSFCSARYKV